MFWTEHAELNYIALRRPLMVLVVYGCPKNKKPCRGTTGFIKKLGYEWFRLRE